MPSTSPQTNLPPKAGHCDMTYDDIAMVVEALKQLRYRMKSHNACFFSGVSRKLTPITNNRALSLEIRLEAFLPEDTV
jgi:hypothetical protein